MDIGSVSIQMNLAKVQNSVGIALTKKVMDQMEVQALDLIEDLEMAVPSFGHQLDILA